MLQGLNVLALLTDYQQRWHRCSMRTHWCTYQETAMYDYVINLSSWSGVSNVICHDEFSSVSMSNHNHTFSLDERPHVLHLIILQSEKSHFCSVSNDAAASFMDIYTLVELKIRPS